MRSCAALTTIAALCAAAVIGPTAATAQDDDLAPILRIKQATYDVKTRGSVSIDWTRKTGQVDKSCAVWSDESGSSTMSFKSKTGRVIVVWNATNPWRFSGQVDASTKRIRSWKRRYGREDTAGCPGVCPPGTAARAADGTCEPAKPAPGPGRDDCGRRTTARTSVPFGIEPRAEDDDDLAELVFTSDPPATLAVGAPLFNSGFFRQCEAFGEELLLSSLPTRLTTSDVRSVRDLAKRRTKRFRATKTNVDCAPRADQLGVTCSMDYDVQTTIRRVR